MQFQYIIDAVIIIFGFYFMYITIQMHRKQEIPSSLLVKEEVDKIKDKKGFMKALYLPMLICAIAFVLLGIFNILLDLKIISFPYDNYLSLGLFLIAFGYYIIVFRRTKEQYISI